MSKRPIPFAAFDEHKPLRIYHNGLLPHWRQKGCTYFVTFRLDDSLPDNLLREIQYEQSLWLKARGIDSEDPEWRDCFACLSQGERRQYERLMARLMNCRLDEGHGCCLLRDAAIAQHVADSLNHFHESCVLTGDFVVMPNHVHVLLTPLEGHELEDTLQSIKRFTAHQINRAAGRTGRLWQRDCYDHIVRDPEQLVAFQNYIAQNPLKAKLRPYEYVLSTAQYSFM